MREWHEKYSDDDFVIIGVHYPEFRYEEDFDNVVDAVERFEIEYPVVLDNDGVIWRRYKQRYWPTRYLIDKQGQIRYKHIGEGAYEETDELIQVLLDER